MNPQIPSVMKKNSSVFILFVLLSSFTQGDISENCRLAMMSGNTKELSNYFASTLELRTKKEEGNYSKEQASLVLKSFFKNNPAKSFNYVHKGTSPGGAKYAIATYESSNGTFRVYIKMKMTNGKYLIDTLDISEE